MIPPATKGYKKFESSLLISNQSPTLDSLKKLRIGFTLEEGFVRKEAKNKVRVKLSWR